MRQTTCVCTQGREVVPFALCRKYGICGHRNWYCRWERTAVVWQGHCGALQPQNGWACEEVTLTVPCNFGCHYSGILLTDSKSVWNKQLELTWFCAGCTFASSFVSDYVCRNRVVCRVLVGKPEGRRPLGRPRSRWVDNIRMDLQEVGCGIWNGLGWPRIGTGGGRLWVR